MARLALHWGAWPFFFVSQPSAAIGSGDDGPVKVRNPSTPGGRWQHQGIFELDELPDAVCCDDFNGDQASGLVIDVDLARMMDQVVELFEGQFDQIILRIVRYPEKRQPFGLDLGPRESDWTSISARLPSSIFDMPPKNAGHWFLSNLRTVIAVLP
jgi:hypothetical protein